MKQKNIEQVRAEFISLVEKCGSDYKAFELLNDTCEGFAPDRSTIGRIRNGEGKPAMIGMATVLLRMAVNNKQN